MEAISLIPINNIEVSTPLHPLTLFVEMAQTLHISAVSTNTKNERLMYTFEYFKTEATAEYCDIATRLNSFTKEYRALPCASSIATVSYIRSGSGNECLSIETKHYDKLKFNKERYSVPTAECLGKEEHVYKTEIHVYDKGIAWNFTRKSAATRRSSTGFPCSMKDFFYYQDKSNAEHEIFHALFLAWGKEYPIWRDLAADFKQGCCYSSIPLDLIFQCGSRKELIEKRYGIRLARCNKEDIGKGIFYARASRVVNENELHLLFNCQLKPCHIGRAKADVADHLTYYIYEKMKEKYPEMRLKRRRAEVEISWKYINDAIKMSIALKRKVPLQFKTLKSIYEWHNELQLMNRNGHLPTVNIPKNSRFKKLKMPENCIRLKTRKMFIEEGNFQNNCVAGYISAVNRDQCSIWSLREPDGTRYTIEVGIYGGKFILNQMLGWDNEYAPPELEEKIKKFLLTQFPPQN